MSARQDKSVKFNELRTLLLSMGFVERVKGDHFIYSKSNIVEIINIQPDGNMAKSYQVRQIRNIINEYGLGEE